VKHRKEREYRKGIGAREDNAVQRAYYGENPLPSARGGEQALWGKKMASKGKKGLKRFQKQNLMGEGGKTGFSGGEDKSLREFEQGGKGAGDVS